ncbi:MAG: diguanylate phosphodiesterase, partial [Planctomycetota bacterium]
MSQLIQLIYGSAAKYSFSRSDLTNLLINARRNNVQLGVTGILLYSGGSFFQVLEGESETVDKLFAKIMGDERHKHVTVIIRESIAKRSFSDWTMAYTDISPQEADTIIGTNDFFGKGESFAQLSQGRAKRLLAAFKHGRWRAKLSNTNTPTSEAYTPTALSGTFPPSSHADTPPELLSNRCYTFAYQPIIDITSGEIISHEALIRGLDNESAEHVLRQVRPSEMHMFDEESRTVAIELAAHIGLSTHLNLNFLPASMESSPTAISSVLAAAERCNIRPEQIVIEILEREIITNFDSFNTMVNEHRSSGLIFAIDDFGAGYAGLNLLADFQPDLIKLDMHLVRYIERKGPRQAIVRGILRTCVDLGIEII